MMAIKTAETCCAGHQEIAIFLSAVLASMSNKKWRNKFLSVIRNGAEHTVPTVKYMNREKYLFNDVDKCEDYTRDICDR
jgi:hypothetical protein